MNRKSRWILAAAPVLGCWWAWMWYAAQLVQNPGAWVGVVPLGVLAVMISREAAATPSDNTSARGLILCAALVALAQVAWWTTTPLIAAAFALAATLTAAVATFRLYATPRAGEVALAVLALPVIDAVQFYFGYPLRATVANGAAAMLNISGFSVSPVGVLLEWNGRFMSVDVECSGLSMLWAGGVLAAGLAAWHRMTWGRSAILAAVALVILVAANALRVSSLFMAMLWSRGELSAFQHEAIGVVVFAAAAAGLVWTACRMKGASR